MRRPVLVDHNAIVFIEVLGSFNQGVSSRLQQSPAESSRVQQSPAESSRLLLCLLLCHSTVKSVLEASVQRTLTFRGIP